MASPVEQFQIKTIGPELHVAGMDISFTNSALFMILATFVVGVFLTQSMSGRHLVPTRIQSLAELSYEFIANMVRENVGPEGRPYFPFIFSLFMFILVGNLLGMIPYSYTFTSQIIVTFAMAITIFVAITIVALIKHGFHFFTFFFPSGAPVYMAPLLIPIEILSYLSRPVSLSVRLFANMMAGHTMMKVFGGFVVALGVFGVAPLLVLVALTGFEILVAVLQAYVFTILTCIYLYDAIHLH
ncbi:MULTISPECIES: F0F1 ATP synthase subunit A [Thalassobaculum]|uniref:ATP synthase subunit a n=1 Tax=Thalassobaculum litoreum DSM 18839 TaxID=1123362 RepID=A0A8G2BKC6_9PROT|nr:MULTISPECIES: F0F1 ATP synthase subunit A [Thalassobaculum]SDG20895.1 ATP synthase F0 subcomplex A subunit [Thalassobaculum litoreum DSM 18839]